MMRKSNVLLFAILFVIATVCCPSKAVPQPEGTSLSPELLTDSKALASILNECKRHAGTVVGHEVGDLQKRIGKEMIPREAADVSTMLRIADECTAYLSSPSLVSGMELPAAQDARREANNTIQRLNELSRTVTGDDLKSLEMRTREHLQSPTSTQSAIASIRQQPPLTAFSTSASAQPVVSYLRASNAPKLPGRMAPEEVQTILAEVSKEATRESDSLLSEAGATVSADLLELYNATMRYPNFARHPLMQSITALKRQLGKSLQPKSVSDVQNITELLSQTIRIFGRSDFQTAYGHIETETRAISQYKAQQAAIVSAENSVANIEQTLDQDRLLDADSQYQRMATDSFLSGFPPSRRYLAETVVLQRELAALREANQVPRVQGSQQLVEQVSVLASEVATAEGMSDRVLATELLKQHLADDRQSVQSRLASLRAFDFDPSMYRIVPITTEDAAREAADRLEELNRKLDSARELSNLLTNPDFMGKVRLLFGEAFEAELRQKGRSIPVAQEMATSLSSGFQAHQHQVAEAEARRQAEAEAAAVRQREAAELAQIQFRELRAEMTKTEVRSLLVHPADALNCSPGKLNSVECRIHMGNTSGTVNFSNEDKLTSYEIKINSTETDKAAPRQAFNELVARMGPGEHSNVFGDSPSFLARTAGSQYTWGTKTTVPCLLDPKERCSSVEMLVGYSDDYAKSISISLWAWGYQARREGLKTPDPNAPHPTSQGELSLFGLHGGGPKPAALNVLGKNNDSGCKVDPNSYETECTLNKGSSQWSLSFYENKLASYRFTFPASDWAQQVASVKAALHVEPTDTDSRTSSIAVSWKSAATLPCAVDAAKRCPMETFIMSKTSGEKMATGFYMYLPVMNKVIRDETNRAMSKYH